MLARTLLEKSIIEQQEPPAPNVATRLDITRDICPMTFVRTRLALDRLCSGEQLLVHLRGDEPRRNIPRTATELGHAVLSVSDQPDGSTLLLLRRK